jgi:gliding motility-associated-like protein
MVNIWKKPIADAGPDRQIFEGDTVTLRGAVSGTDISVAWTPAISIQDANTVTPVVNPSDKTVYTLTATSALGCGVSDDQVTVNVYKKISPPNIFSPNGDGVNDTWVIPGIETLPKSQVHVYDRMGRAVFSTRSAEKVWDGMYKGKPIPVGTYYYIIETGLNQPPLSGWVLIMR